MHEWTHCHQPPRQPPSVLDSLLPSVSDNSKVTYSVFHRASDDQNPLTGGVGVGTYEDLRTT